VNQQESLLRFLKAAYPDQPRKCDPSFWRWHFLEHPHIKLNEPPLWVVTCGSDIVGQLATIPVQLKAGDALRPAIWILDFIVREDFRGQGLGKRLVQRARESFPTMITLGINAQSAGLFRSLGWSDLGTIRRYYRLLYAGHATEKAANLAPVRKALNMASAPLRWSTARSPRNPRYAARIIERFGSEFDALWDRSSTQWLCAARRDTHSLAWQFERQPGKTFEILGLYQGERLKGYAVLFFRKGRAAGAPPKAAISDLGYEPENAQETVDALIEFAVAEALQRRAGSLVTDVLDPLAEASLTRQGFWRIHKAPRFMAYTEDSQDPIHDPRNWFLTRADSDVSILEAPNLQ
jgi:GNAT superfamily N-acetyltransferase